MTRSFFAAPLLLAALCASSAFADEPKAEKKSEPAYTIKENDKSFDVTVPFGKLGLDDPKKAKTEHVLAASQKALEGLAKDQKDAFPSIAGYETKRKDKEVTVVATRSAMGWNKGRTFTMEDVAKAEPIALKEALEQFTKANKPELYETITGWKVERFLAAALFEINYIEADKARVQRYQCHHHVSKEDAKKFVIDCH